MKNGNVDTPAAGDAQWDAEDLLALYLVPGIGRITLRKVLVAAAVCDMPLRALLIQPDALCVPPCPLAPDAGAMLREGAPRALGLAAEEMDRARDAGLGVLTFDAQPYPAALRAYLGHAAPPLLFTRGNQALLTREMAAIVGTRAPSREGRTLARQCAVRLSAEGIAVLSGAARGIDSAAQGHALSAGGESVGVLPQGLLTFALPEAWRGALEEGRLLLLSEFSPCAAWQTHAAVTRNATIAALARIVCVIEARKSGGSVQTARTALAQGKRVLYAAPSSRDALWLKHALATPLTDGAGCFSPEQLHAAWEAPLCEVPRQSELF